MPRYVIELTGGNARRMENWLGSPLEIGPVGDPGAALIARIEGITDEEFRVIADRVERDGALYHHGGAESIANAEPTGQHGPVPHAPPV